MRNFISQNGKLYFCYIFVNSIEYNYQRIDLYWYHRIYTCLVITNLTVDRQFGTYGLVLHSQLNKQFPFVWYTGRIFSQVEKYLSVDVCFLLFILLITLTIRPWRVLTRRCSHARVVFASRRRCRWTCHFPSLYSNITNTYELEPQ